MPRVHLFGALAALLLGGAATAAPVLVTFEKVSPGIGSAGQYNWNTGGTTYDGMVYSPYGNGSLSANHFVTFCIEQNQFINPNTAYSGYEFALLTDGPSPGPAMSSGTADALSMMWAEFFGSLDTAAESAAFQQAVWHLLNPGYSPTPTPVAVVDGYVDYYSLYLDPANWKSGKANLGLLKNGGQQDQIFELKKGYTVVDGNIVPTPEPGTLLLGLLVVPAVAVGLRRRKAV
jgi:hypothetical protein